MARLTQFTSADSSRVASSPDAGGLGSDSRKPAPALLMPLASVKVTVALFLMSIFIVFAGTLAQCEKDIWQVVDEYFRMDFRSWPAAWYSALAWIDFRIFFPRSFFPYMEPIAWGYGFYFPKGWLIGLGLFINLTSAHIVHFRIQGTGRQFVAGLVTLLVGCALTAAVILAGSHRTAELPQLFVQWPSLRILWLLTQCTAASLVLLLGCLLTFHQRAGIVLLHAGIGLLMVSELITGMSAQEAQMQIVEGQTVNYVMDTRDLELALIDRSDEVHDEVFAIPRSRLQRGVVLADDPLPVQVECIEYLPNCTLREVRPTDTNLATKGIGLEQIAVPAPLLSGTDTSGRANTPAAYVRFFDKQSGTDLGTYLLALRNWMQDRAETVKWGDKTYAVQLRYLHEYQPYSMHLVDVEQQVYIGTQTPRSYSSELRLVDPAAGVDREVRIWMNNPLRYAGSTFYQSNYGRDPVSGKEYTGLQVVTNTGWRIPYVSCMIVVVGMLAQFMISLGRYLRRRADGPVGDPESGMSAGPAAARSQAAPQLVSREAAGRGIRNWLFPAAVVLLCALWLGSTMRPEALPPSGADLAAFGRLPVTFEGRVKPFDTLARTSLRKISDRQTYIDASGQRQPAIRWLLDVITDASAAREHPVFRIHNLDVLETLGLDRRKGFRYAIAEFADRLPAFEEQVQRARSMKAEQRDLYARKILELDGKLNEFWMLQEAFRPPQLRLDHLREDLAEEANRRERLADFPLPLAVPPPRGGENWQAYTFSLFDALAQRMAAAHGEGVSEPNPATLALLGVLSAYNEDGGPATAFNQKVAGYARLLEEKDPVGWNPAKIRFEAFFNHAAPLYYCIILYALSFLLGCLAWFGWTVPLKRGSIWLCAFTLLVHTLALMARMYISGRPPITTLYTSTLFVGWGCVLLGLLMERYSRIGVANVVAAAAGFLALLIGYKLTTSVVSFKGDTFTVLVAVLDTNFWLATHVTAIAAGYSATFLAGFLGIAYVVRGLFSPSLSPALAKDVARMIYGTVCFALFFSFFGTVLGGLWADDSWGRFWGWDPKENGALIIVLWNAVVLHARWGHMIADRGLAVLAIVGNIVTAWSWFGVNELGVGLHSYGFTEGVLLILGGWVLLQLAFILCGLVPQRLWLSHVARSSSEP